MSPTIYICPILTELHISRGLFRELPHIKFHGNTFGGSCADNFGQMDGQTDILTRSLIPFPSKITFCENLMSLEKIKRAYDL